MIIFVMSFISRFEIINGVICKAKSKGCPDLNRFLWIAAFVADAVAVNPNGIKMLLVNGLSTFYIKWKTVFSNGLKSLPRNPPDYPILSNWVFDDFILAEELFTKALRSLETCVLVGNNLWEKLFSSLESPTTFDESFKITSVLFYNRF